jgi:hypothetical protein
MKLKVPEIDLQAHLPEPDVPTPEHWHEWYCGCKTRMTSKGFEIIYCSETCEFYLAFTRQEGEDNGNNPCTENGAPLQEHYETQTPGDDGNH